MYFLYLIITFHIWNTVRLCFVFSYLEVIWKSLGGRFGNHSDVTLKKLVSHLEITRMF